MNKTILWRIYRDDGKEALPKKLARLIPIYKEKMGRIPSVIGLPISMLEYEVVEELKKRFQVEFSVPAWAGSEIWLGEPAPLSAGADIPPNAAHSRGEGPPMVPPNPADLGGREAEHASI